MEKTIKFYKKEDRWYAYIPEYLEQGGTEADCEMVLGAGVWLEANTESGKSEITLLLSNLFLAGDGVLDKICCDVNGAVYYLRDNPDFLMWLCNVNLWLWAEHPDTIFYKIVN